MTIIKQAESIIQHFEGSCRVENGCKPAKSQSETWNPVQKPVQKDAGMNARFTSIMSSHIIPDSWKQCSKIPCNCRLMGKIQLWNVCAKRSHLSFLHLSCAKMHEYHFNYCKHNEAKQLKRFLMSSKQLRKMFLCFIVHISVCISNFNCTFWYLKHSFQLFFPPLVFFQPCVLLSLGLNDVCFSLSSWSAVIHHSCCHCVQ